MSDAAKAIIAANLAGRSSMPPVDDQQRASKADPLGLASPMYVTPISRPDILPTYGNLRSNEIQPGGLEAQLTNCDVTANTRTSPAGANDAVIGGRGY